MKRTLLLFLASLIALSAQPRHVTSFHQNITPRPKTALVDVNDRVFPDLVAGGGWETIITLVNMSNVPAQFTITFYDDEGDPLRMPLVNPDGSISRFASSDFTLDANTSSELVVANVDKEVISGWSYMSFLGGTAPIAGVAVIRRKGVDGKVISESAQTLSNTQDYDFFAPFDNLDHVTTAVILLNPGNSQTANVQLSAQDAAGREIIHDQFKIPAGARTVISLPDTYPALDGISGKLRVTGDTNTLSAICFRTSPSGSVAYSPLFNWSGMFR